MAGRAHRPGAPLPPGTRFAGNLQHRRALIERRHRPANPSSGTRAAGHIQRRQGGAPACTQSRSAPSASAAIPAGPAPQIVPSPNTSRRIPSPAVRSRSSRPHSSLIDYRGPVPPSPEVPSDWASPKGTFMSDSSHDFDFIVIGSGFGGSVTRAPAHRKGLPRGGHGDGPPLDAREPAQDQLDVLALDLAAAAWRCAVSSTCEFFRHVIILHGCAVGGGSITYANTMLVPRDSVWENGSWAGLADWKREMPRALRDRHPDAGRRREPHPRPGRPHPASGRRRDRRGPHVLPHQGRRLRAARRARPAARPTPIRISAAKAPTRTTCIALRRLHGGLPLQRQEHAGQELSLPGREAWRARVRRRPGWWM